MTAAWKTIAACIAAVAGLSSSTPAAAADTSAADIQEVRALFLRQAAGATAKDINEMDAVIAKPQPGQPDTVSFVARSYRYSGRDEVMAHFRKIFTGTWRFEPDESAIRVTLMGSDVAQIYAPTRVTAGAAGQPATTSQFYMSELAIRTPEGWRIASFVAVPAQ
jgi:ketosteroid isomerase-like protein